jgi:5-methylcytosine-specific restriction endonuclease McrA
LYASQKTNLGMPPQSQALESRSVDKLRGEYETGSRVLQLKEAGVQHGREETSRKTGVTPEKGAKGIQRVFVLDRRGNPLVPCNPARARELLRKKRAVVHKVSPFAIRLKDRTLEQSAVQPIRLGVDPGSKTTGMVISRDDQGVRHVLFKLEVAHRSAVIHKKMQQRASYRQRRRSRNLRYRASRFLNRTRPKGWLAPSLRSRVQHIDSWARRFQRWCPLSVIDLELVRFDIQKMVNPEITGVEYQRGILAGYEVREYLLAKFGHQCVYCDAKDVPLNIDHVVSRSRGGSDRVSNLVLACVPCNQRKNNRSIKEFCPERAARILARCKAPLRDAAAVNSTRLATLASLKGLGLPVHCSTGGRTKWNRSRFGIPKTHALDAACVGEMNGIRSWNSQTLAVKATGRGRHQRTTTDAYGFPRSFLPRVKRIHGFQTGDLVKAVVPKGKHTGRHIGRVSVRSIGSFRVGETDGISHRHCKLIQRTDGFERMK